MITTAERPLLSEAAPIPSPDPLGLELRRPGQNRWAAILPNPSDPAKPYKVQYFTRSGLARHDAYATPQAAYRAAQRRGYTEPDPGVLDRLSQTPAWRLTYATSSAAGPRLPPGPERADRDRRKPEVTLSAALRRVLSALTWLSRHGVTVEAITLRRGPDPPRIVIRGTAPALAWCCITWGHDSRGRYRRLAAPLEGCQVVQEVREGPARPYARR